MKIGIVGAAGRMALGALPDLAESADVDQVVLIDRDMARPEMERRAQKYGAGKFSIATCQVDDGEAFETALGLAQRICAKASPSALAATKALLNETVGLGWRVALATAVEANVRQRMHPECRRGVRSFLETKTTPNWLDDDSSE